MGVLMTTSTKKLKLSYIFYILLFIIFLVALRWIWYQQLSSPNPPTVKEGLLDLRGIELEDLNTFPMNGEWLFYPEQWVDASNVNEASQGQMLQVPANWTADSGAYGYGTYHLRILLDRPFSESLGIWFQSIYTASEVEINGETVAQLGKLAEERDGQVPETRPFLVTYDSKGQTELDLFVRVANYQSPLQGGLIKSVQFGTHDNVNQKYLSSIGFQLIVCVIFLLHALYALIIYLMDVRKKEFIIFLFMMVTGAMTIAFNYNGFLYMLIPIEFEWLVKLKAFASIWFAFCALLMARVFIGIRHNSKIFYSYFFLLITFTLFILVGPEEIVLYSIEKDYYRLFYYTSLLWTGYYFMKMVLNKAEGAIFLLFAVISVFSNVLWGYVYYAGTAQFMFYPIDLIAAITCFSAYWFKRYFHNSNKVSLLNTQLTEANRLKDRFLANTSHELRTPLHGIINIAQSVLTKKKHVLDNQSQRDMDLLIKISRQMSSMINDLLDVVRLQDKRIAMRMMEVDVQSVATGVLDMLQFLTDGTKVELRMNIEDGLPHVHADEKRLVQILINLVHNALKYTKEGTVELTAEQDQEHVWIKVKDTGLGMDEATQKRAFMRYEQGTFGEGGIGLGLNICKELIELHGSELIVQSQLDKGSVFSFKLPIFDENLQSSIPVNTEDFEHSLADVRAQITGEIAAASYDIKETLQIQMPHTSTERFRVLVVDDDSVNLKVITHILSSEDYQIETVNSANEAMDKLSDEQWDLIIADVMMPDTSGYELTRMIRKRFSMFELPIILLTARDEPEDIYAGFLAGANDYVTKPTDALELKYRAWSLSSLKRAVNDRLSMEAAYLQAQIQPHFLFNTLNSILSLSYTDVKKMRKLAEVFASYLRISFEFLTASKLVPLSRELELVQNYLYIQQQRFGERLQVEWEVNTDTEILVPPLIVQPLVENAVRHGILNQLKGGTLRIRIEKRADAVHFFIIDTGSGMDDEQIRMLLSPENKEHQGIGLFNTHSRLIRMYGQGLHIQSKPGEGTTVSFIIPDKIR